MVGHGVNTTELAANPRLDRWFVQDLNADPALPLGDGSLDAALCCVGVQYLQRPFKVFAEVQRVLSPDAPFVVSFANRLLPTKAVAIWRSLDMVGQASLIGMYGTRRVHRHRGADAFRWLARRSADRRGRPGLITASLSFTPFSHFSESGR